MEEQKQVIVSHFVLLLAAARFCCCISVVSIFPSDIGKLIRHFLFLYFYRMLDRISLVSFLGKRSKWRLNGVETG